MPRKGPAQRREIFADPIYHSLVVTQLVNKVMLHGKKSIADKIVYDALKIVETKTGAEPIATLKRAVENIKPPLEVRSRRVGGATYQVPVEVRPRRATHSLFVGLLITRASVAKSQWLSVWPMSCLMPRMVLAQQ